VINSVHKKQGYDGQAPAQMAWWDLETVTEQS
jgi:hypothetical protein